ncbi:MAG: heme o synthase [Chloroflexales bacterium]|nr:heme o synthase [Chloroflexales bacterium]
MNTPAYRRLLLVSAVVTFILIVSGSVVRIAGSGSGCADWPLCYGQIIPPPRPDSWIEFVHRLLALATSGFIVAVSLIAWRRRDSDPWVRRPPLLAPVLLLLQVLLGGIIVQFDSPELVKMFHLGMAMIILACLIIPSVALAVADEGHRMTDRTTSRVGGRAMAQARRYRQLVFGAAVVIFALILTGAGLATSVVQSGASITSAGGIASLLAASHRGALLLAIILFGAVLWTTWRTRRNDYVFLVVVGLAALLLLVQTGTSIAALALDANMTLSPVENTLSLSVWSTMVVLNVLALRRPIPPMVEVSLGVAARRASIRPTQPSLIADYISLTKPKVISLLLVTTLAAMFITDQGAPSLSLVFWTMLGGYLAAGGAGAINCAFDSDIDLYMGRTSRRPVPSGRISRRQAFWFGITLGLLAFVVLALFTTLLAAVLAMLGLIYYALLYTRWLKRSTWQNIVIGGGAGSIPPLVGWTAVTGTLTLPAILLFVIIFYWTPPHFWALALVKQKDYARAGVPMLPVVAGEAETRQQIWLYSLLMVSLSLLLTPLDAMGLVYLGAAALLGAIFLRDAWQVWRKGDQASIWRLYKYSLLYLALLFVAMVIDRLLLV